MSKDNLFEEYHRLVVTVNCWLAPWHVLWQERPKKSIVAGIPEQKIRVSRVCISMAKGKSIPLQGCFSPEVADC